VQGERHRYGFIEKEARKVLFVGGEMATLLKRYDEDATAKGLRMDWELTDVAYLDISGEIRHAKASPLSIGEMLAGRSILAKLEETLKGTIAIDMPGAEMFARTHGLDLTCGSRK
jgi:hypothetical protein